MTAVFCKTGEMHSLDASVQYYYYYYYYNYYVMQLWLSLVHRIFVAVAFANPTVALQSDLVAIAFAAAPAEFVVAGWATEMTMMLMVRGLKFGWVVIVVALRLVVVSWVTPWIEFVDLAIVAATVLEALFVMKFLAMIWVTPLTMMIANVGPNL